MAGEAHGAGADPVQVRDAIQSRRTLIVAVSRPTGFTLAQFSGRGRARCVSSLLDVSRPAGDIAPGPGAAAAGFDGPLDAASPRSQWKAKSRCFSRSNNVSRPGVSPKSRSQKSPLRACAFRPWTLDSPECVPSHRFQPAVVFGHLSPVLPRGESPRGGTTFGTPPYINARSPVPPGPLFRSPVPPGPLFTVPPGPLVPPFPAGGSVSAPPVLGAGAPMPRRRLPGIFSPS
jgi:hypothetical protein